MKFYEAQDTKFAALTPAMEAVIEFYPYDDMIVTMTDIRMTEKALELHGLDPEELMAVRNSVVMYLAERSDDVFEKHGRNDTWDRLRTNMSAVTAVIDNRIYR